MKIGILTHYYGSTNCGGCLQAYALCEFLNNQGFDAEQICYDMLNPQNYTFFSTIKNITSKTAGEKINRIFSKDQPVREDVAEILEIRTNSFINFRENITKHSDKIIVDTTVSQIKNDYDAFITGSDQVWNYEWFHEPYYLNFVSAKLKIAYATSLGHSTLMLRHKSFLRKALADFTAVSVRENHSLNLIQNLSPVLVSRTCDPTLLLERNDWDKVCSDRLCEDDYIFCYFLGNSKTQRDLAQEYATKYNLKIVTPPYLLGTFRECDEHFGDIKIADVSPENFISLIKHAKYVFTDSFHAMLFAGIYQKQYFVFNREGESDMSSRIYTLTSLYETQERFCNKPEHINIDYLSSLKKIDYTRKLISLDELIHTSKLFLKDSLRKK